MWFWPSNVHAWWLLEDIFNKTSKYFQNKRIDAQLVELDRLHASLEELKEL